MRYPCLVLKSMCRTPVSGTVNREGYGNFGEPLAGISFAADCNYQDVTKTVYTSQKKLVESHATVLFPGDICPGIPTISGGTVTVLGMEREIASGCKARNPDGTVNYTKLELI